MKNKRLMIFFMFIIFLAVFVSDVAFGGFVTTKSITAVYNGLKIYVNDQAFESNVKPFIFNGTLMVSVRDICDALGLSVYWEKDTNSVFISRAKDAKPSSNYFIPGYKYWDENKPAVKIENIKVLRNVGPFYKSQEKLMIAGRSFSSGIAVEVNDEFKKAEVVLDLYKQFSTLEGYYGVDDQTKNSSSEYTLNFYGDDILLYQSASIKPANYPVLLPPGKLDLRDINRLKIEVCWQGNPAENNENESEEVRTGDYKEIIAALGEFKFYKK